VATKTAKMRFKIEIKVKAIEIFHYGKSDTDKVRLVVSLPGTFGTTNLLMDFHTLGGEGRKYALKHLKVPESMIQMFDLPGRGLYDV